MPQPYAYARFFPPYFSCSFCRFSILVFLTFSFIFSTPSWKWRSTLFVLELRHLFLWFSGHSVQKKKCQIVEEIWTMIERVVKSKGLRRQPRSGWPFFTNCVRNIIEKAASIGVIIPKNRKVKTFQLHIIDQSFEHNGMDVRPTRNSARSSRTSQTVRFLTTLLSQRSITLEFELGSYSCINLKWSWPICFTNDNIFISVSSSQLFFDNKRCGYLLLDSDILPSLMHMVRKPMGC